MASDSRSHGYMLDALRPASLTALADKHNTDKGSVPGLLGHPHRYAPIYQRYLDAVRHHPVHLLEIGVHRGASLRLWEEYLPNARIVGVDIDPTSRLAASTRSAVEIGDATNREFIRDVVRRHLDGVVDIVIDDGSHVLGQQLAAFANLFPVMTEGGLYFVEDICAGRFRPWNGGESSFSDFHEFAAWLSGQLTFFPNDRFDTYHSITDPRQLNVKEPAQIRSAWTDCIHEVSSFHNLCVISKARRIFPYEISTPSANPSVAHPLPELDARNFASDSAGPTDASRRGLTAGATRSSAGHPPNRRSPGLVGRFLSKQSRSLRKRLRPVMRDGLRRAIEALPVASKRKARLWRQALGYSPWLPGAHPPDVSFSSKYDLIILANIDYLGTGTHRPHHIALQHARAGHRVFYVIAAPTLPTESDIAYDAAKVAPNVYRVRARATSFDHYGSVIDDVILDQFLHAIGSLATDWRIADAAIHVHLPSWTRLALALRKKWRWPVVYDCMDEWNGFPKIGTEQLLLEKTLVAQADAVAVTARPLEEKFKPAAKRCLLVRNGVEYALFEGHCRDNRRFTFSHPTIGFYGTIAEWVDLDLIDAVARAHPDWQLVLAGPSFADNLHGLDKRANVTLLGPLPYADMPALLWHFDVAIIPFRVTTMTHSVNPVKLHEYLAGGKPVVAARLRELEDYSDVVSFGDDPASFVGAVERALTCDTPEAATRRRALARTADWTQRYLAFDRLTRDAWPTVSIIVVTFNNLKYTRLCLESVLKNTTLPDFEVIVIDNASDDGTREYLDSLAAADGRLRIVRNATNRGFAAANNQGLKLATGKILLLLNNDVIVPRGWLRGMLRVLEDESVGLVGPVANSVGNQARIAVDYISLDEIDDFAVDHMAANIGVRFDIAVLAMYCIAMRREVWEQVGDLDEQFGIGLFEDDDYSNRARKAGYGVVCTPESFVHHFGQTSFKKLVKSGEYDALWKRNQAYYESKWGPWSPHKTGRQP
jgi:GT2 family glycosyltransferase/glycosyltransferase involved in cell wall biosynthesis